MNRPSALLRRVAALAAAGCDACRFFDPAGALAVSAIASMVP
jgi:hypothetical protein